MSVVRFDQKRRKPGPTIKVSGDPITRALAFAALFAVCALGWVSVDQFVPGEQTLTRWLSPAPVADARRVQFAMCGRDRHTCIVDGDTIWLDGRNLRLQSYDTPEPYNDICGGQTEIALAHRASARLRDLLSTNAFTVQSSGQDRYGRTLATIRIDGRDVGDILIEEGLARRWPDGQEFWCS